MSGETLPRFSELMKTATKEQSWVALMLALAKHSPDFKQEVLEGVNKDDGLAIFQLFIEASPSINALHLFEDASRFLLSVMSLERGESGIDKAKSIRRCFKLLRGMAAHFSMNAIGKFSEEPENLYPENFFLDPLATFLYEQDTLLTKYGPVEGQVPAIRKRIEENPQVMNSHVQGLAYSMYWIGKDAQPIYYQGLRDILDQRIKNKEFMELEPPKLPPIPEGKETIFVEGVEMPVVNIEDVGNMTRKQRGEYVRRAVDNDFVIREEDEDGISLPESEAVYRCSQMVLAITKWLMIVSSQEQSGKNISSEELEAQHAARHEILSGFLTLRQNYFDSEEVLTLFSYLTKDVGLGNFMNRFTNKSVNTFLSGVTGELTAVLSFVDEGREIELGGESEDRMGVDFMVKPQRNGTEVVNRGLAVQVKAEINQKHFIRYDLNKVQAKTELFRWINKQKVQQKIRATKTVDTLLAFAHQKNLEPVWIVVSSSIDRALEKHKGSILQRMYRTGVLADDSIDTSLD
ncbi:MAG: hypothetical protein ABI758_05970 [Candidatus Woesebacteria bacterium]